MTDGYYDHKMDIWGAGCVFYEILTLVPLFPGNNELDMIHRIHNVLGTPNPRVLERFKRHASHLDFNFPERAGTGLEKLLPHVSRECIDLLRMLLAYDPEERITADQALKHEYFKDLLEADRQKEFQSSLTSIRLSPRVGRPLNQTHTLEHDRSEKSLYSDHDRSMNGHQTQATNIKKVSLKQPKNNKSQSKFPHLNLSMKIEGIFKPQFSSNDTPTEDDSKKSSILPPLKQNAITQFDNKFHLAQNSYVVMNPKKKDDTKRYSNTLLKPTLSNQSLFKKSKKASMVYRSPDYLLMGKKMS